VSGGDYLLALLAIITGLAISGLVVSFHELLLDRRHVKWDWLTLLAAGYIFVLIVITWGVSYRSLHNIRDGEPIWIFLVVLWQLIPIYLAARAIFPDNVRLGNEVTLAAHYSFVGRYVWGALSISLILYAGLAALLAGPIYLAANRWDVLLGIPICLTLAISQSRRVHCVLVPVMVLWLCAFHFADRLGG
jgi:hypothetical protein